MNPFFFKSGDPIFMLYSSKVLGKLGLPRAMLSKECVDSNPAGKFVFDVLVRYSCIMLWDKSGRNQHDCRKQMI